MLLYWILDFSVTTQGEAKFRTGGAREWGQIKSGWCGQGGAAPLGWSRFVLLFLMNSTWQACQIQLCNQTWHVYRMRCVRALKGAVNYSWKMLRNVRNVPFLNDIVQASWGGCILFIEKNISKFIFILVPICSKSNNLFFFGRGHQVFYTGYMVYDLNSPFAFSKNRINDKLH